MFRLVNPTSELRIAGGRELHLGSLQPLGLYAANSIFVGDYLTTKGQAPEADYRMIARSGVRGHRVSRRQPMNSPADHALRSRSQISLRQSARPGPEIQVAQQHTGETLEQVDVYFRQPGARLRNNR